MIQKLKSKNLHKKNKNKDDQLAWRFATNTETSSKVLKSRQAKPKGHDNLTMPQPD